MLSIGIYSEQQEDIEQIKSIIQDFLIETKTMAKVSFFNEPDTFSTIPEKYDIYIMDMESDTNVLSLGMQRMQIDTDARFVYLNEDVSLAHKITRIRANYFLTKPIEKEETLEVLREIKKHIQDEIVIIKIPSGERRVRVNNLNYINIVKRCLCYHLKDGAMFDGQTLRSSFEKAIYPLQNNKAFLFLAPSLLINLGEIKIVKSDNIVFENDDVLFFPKKSYDFVRESWIKYNRILD